MMKNTALKFRIRILITTLCLCRITALNAQQLSISTVHTHLPSYSDTTLFSIVPEPEEKLDFQRRKLEFARSLKVSVPLIAIGAFANSNFDIINKYEIREESMEHFSRLRTVADNYLIYVPTAAVYAMNALGYKGQHNIGAQTVLLAKSELFMNTMVISLKKSTHVLRPDGTSYNSFPSGHTAQAFLSAEFFRKEYGKDYPLLAAGGYVVATSVGALRIMKNRHWVSDVLAGAGVGILSVNLAYLTQKGNWPFNNQKFSLAPTFTGSGAGVYLNVPLGN